MNKLIKTLEHIPEDAKITLSDVGLSIGHFHISDHHDQDCCEHVYVDWEQLKYHFEAIRNLHPTSLEIKGVEQMGILLVFRAKYNFKTPIKVFLPCYNDQNGYYSDELKLVVEDTRDNHKTIIDINPFVDDVI